MSLIFCIFLMLVPSVQAGRFEVARIGLICRKWAFSRVLASIFAIALIFLVFFSGVVVLAQASEPAQSHCSELLTFESTDSEIDVLLQQQRWQEALWRLYRDRGAEEAEELEQRLVEILSGEVLHKEEIKIASVYRLEFAEGVRAIFKPLVTPSFTNKAEERAYRLDKALGHNFHVPLTLYRQIGDQMGSLQLEIPQPKIKHDPIPAAVILFDLLIGNMDRMPHHNLLYTLGDDFVAIDNAQAVNLMGVKPYDKHRIIQIWIKEACGADLQGSLSDQLRLCLESKSVDLEKFRSIVLSIDSEIIKNIFKDDLDETYIFQILDNLELLKQV